MIDIFQLVTWLGADGAKAGLEKSELTIAELLESFSEILPKNTSKLKRSDIIDHVVDVARKKNQKSIEELFEMSTNELQEYFIGQRFSRKDLLDILYQLEINPGSAAKKNLTNFTIDEISAIGMYKRIAKGNHS